MNRTPLAPLVPLVLAALLPLVGCDASPKVIPANETIVELSKPETALELDLGESVVLVLPPPRTGPWRLESGTPNAVALSRFQPVRDLPGDGLPDGSWWVAVIGARLGTDRLVLTTEALSSPDRINAFNPGQRRVVNVMVVRALREAP